MPDTRIFNISRYDTGDRSLFVLSGEVDLASAPLVRRWLSRCLHDGFGTIDVDLSEVTFCDCVGIGVFVEAWRLATAAGGTLRLLHPNFAVARLLELTDTARRLQSPPQSPEVPAEHRTPTASFSYLIVADEHPEEFVPEPRHGRKRPSHD